MTLKEANKSLATDNIEIRRFRSRAKFAGSNYRVVLKRGPAQTMPDGSFWDGCENVGHFRFVRDAVETAIQTAKERA